MKTIFIDGPIGQRPGEISARWVRSQIPSDGSEIELRFHSEGGSVFESFAIYDVLSSYRGRKTAIVSSMAFSAASLLVCVCDEIEMSPNAYLMLHNPHIEDSTLDQSQRQLLASLCQRMVQIYCGRTRKSVSEIQRLMAGETFLNASESVQHGFADKVLDARQMRVAARAIPANIVAKLTPSNSGKMVAECWRLAKAECRGDLMKLDRTYPGLRQQYVAVCNQR